MMFLQHVYTLVLHWTVKIFFPTIKEKMFLFFLILSHLSDPKVSIIHSEDLKTSEILLNRKGTISSALIIHVNSEHFEV